ncbi:MAG TPA: DNA mismatch repair endonuclease MutL, partial [Candidatus Binatia bacterium]|nr:DNA mismatch repair endonuclease MutL [Candidatus Binatia bacterium]
MVGEQGALRSVKISILSEEMASHIAAGEVIERPASVVKELLENSLDAGATEISVWLEKSGTSLVRVTDNGEGVAPEDLPLAVERHATSKLKEENDLFRIATLGFRGEALPSMASVSNLEISSRPHGASVGCRLSVHGGTKSEPIAIGCAAGTTVEVRDLFYKTPARKKFLKSPATELSHICDIINRMALAFHAVHFRLYHDGRTVSDYTAVSERRDRLHQVLGRETAKELIAFDQREGELTINGYLSTAPSSFSNSRYLLTYVNQRYVRDRILTHAILQGYETLLMKGRYPAVALYLEIPFDEVDVNVHPAKYEVRFRRQSAVHDTVETAIRQALRQDAKQPTAKSTIPKPLMAMRVNEPELLYAPPPGSFEYFSPDLRDAPAPIQSEVGEEGFFSSMTILGQVLGCYLVCSSARGLALIDQHAAHERVVFEKMRHQMGIGDVQKQSLLVPQTFELTAGEALLLEQTLASLEHLGFSIEPFGLNTFAITAVPALLPNGDYRQIVRQMVAELAEVDTSQGLKKERDERLATSACHSV